MTSTPKIKALDKYDKECDTHIESLLTLFSKIGVVPEASMGDKVNLTLSTLLCLCVNTLYPIMMTTKKIHKERGESVNAELLVTSFCQHLLEGIQELQKERDNHSRLH